MHCAIKIVQKDKVNSSKMKMEHMINELIALESMTHPHLVHTYELLHDSKRYYIVTELLKQGDLFEFLEKRQNDGQKYIPEEDAQMIAKQLFTAVMHMHKKNMVHRDIKLENILIEASGNEESSADIRIKLIDFGFA